MSLVPNLLTQDGQPVIVLTPELGGLIQVGAKQQRIDTDGVDITTTLVDLLRKITGEHKMSPDNQDQDSANASVARPGNLEISPASSQECSNPNTSDASSTTSSEAVALPGNNDAPTVPSQDNANTAFTFPSLTTKQLKAAAKAMDISFSVMDMSTAKEVIQKLRIAFQDYQALLKALKTLDDSFEELPVKDVIQKLELTFQELQAIKMDLATLDDSFEKLPVKDVIQQVQQTFQELQAIKMDLATLDHSFEELPVTDVIKKVQLAFQEHQATKNDLETIDDMFEERESRDSSYVAVKQLASLHVAGDPCLLRYYFKEKHELLTFLETVERYVLEAATVPPGSLLQTVMTRLYKDGLFHYQDKFRKAIETLAWTLIGTTSPLTCSILIGVVKKTVEGRDPANSYAHALRPSAPTMKKRIEEFGQHCKCDIVTKQFAHFFTQEVYRKMKREKKQEEKRRQVGAGCRVDKEDHLKCAEFTLLVERHNQLPSFFHDDKDDDGRQETPDCGEPQPKRAKRSHGTT